MTVNLPGAKHFSNIQRHYVTASLQGVSLCHCVTESQGSLRHCDTQSLRPEAASLSTLSHCVTQGREFLWNPEDQAGDGRVAGQWREFVACEAKSNDSLKFNIRLIPAGPEGHNRNSRPWVTE